MIFVVLTILQIIQKFDNSNVGTVLAIYSGHENAINGMEKTFYCWA